MDATNTTTAPATVIRTSPKVEHIRTEPLGAGRYLLSFRLASDALDIEVQRSATYDPERQGGDGNLLAMAELHRSRLTFGAAAGSFVEMYCVVALPANYSGPAYVYAFPLDFVGEEERPGGGGRLQHWRTYAGAMLGPTVDPDPEDFALRFPLTVED